MPTPDIRAVVFDAVGTLIDADPPVIRVYHQAGARYGSSLTIGELSARLKAAISRNFRGECSNEELERSRWRHVVAETFADVSDSSNLFQELWDHFADAAHWRAASDADTVCRELRLRGYAVAVGSNFDARLLKIARSLSPLDTIGSIFVSSKVGYSKPHPEFFRQLQTGLQFAPSQLLMVGDSWTNDYAAARSAGWSSLWLAPRDADTSSEVITSLSDVLDYLD